MFRDRLEAARMLAERLRAHRDAPHTVVAGIPEGGAAVAAVVAVELELPYTCIGLYKVPTPAMPDLPMSVLDEDGEVTYDFSHQLTRHSVRKVGSEMLARVRHDMDRCRRGRPRPDLRDATVIVVDEAVFSARSVTAACRYLRRRGAARIVLATPVLAMQVSRDAAECVDEVVALERGQATRLEHYYERATPLSHDEIAPVVEKAFARTVA